MSSVRTFLSLFFVDRMKNMCKSQNEKWKNQPIQHEMFRKNGRIGLDQIEMGCHVYCVCPNPSPWIQIKSIKLK